MSCKATSAGPRPSAFRLSLALSVVAAAGTDAIAQRRGGGEPPVELFRTIDGRNNNLRRPDLGAAGTALRRMTEARYADGSSSPAGPSRPNARAISNAVAAQSDSVLIGAPVTDFLWQWGQFLDHDIGATEAAHPEESFDVAVPIGDPHFDPFGTGAVVISLSRSHWVASDRGVREQVNDITAYIDASNVYGSDPARAAALRTANGLLATSAGNLMPFNTGGFANAPSSQSPRYFLAGDARANEQVGLIAMHTLFVREHNQIALLLRYAGLDPESCYRLARMLVAAEMQAITYNEFLPALLGRGALRSYRGYREDLDPSIANEFSAAAYRVGHTMLSPQLQRIGADGRSIPDGPLPLRAAFFAPGEVITHGIDPILRGLASQRPQAIDSMVVDDVRNFLFGPPGAGGFDLASLNIQRGRDHGLPSYVEMRRELGMRPVRSVRDITSRTEVQQRLSSVYRDVRDIDLWVGGLSEEPAGGGLIGETFRRILIDQFERLRDGDRFWYQRILPPDLQGWVEGRKLSTIIRANTGIGFELQDDVFRL